MAAPTKLRFVLDGEIVELDRVDPTRTVLEYLREDLGRTGTKEGCAEGDCGACTVVVAELDDGGDDLELRAVNACIQFLGTLDGKELITVESLATDANDLHPVQRAMVEQHGSQCGFCTPGFVMSLFALYKANPTPSRRDIDDALAGNLCRCTGYRPIVDAARAMAGKPAGDDWLRQPAGAQSPPTERLMRLRKLRRDAAATFADGERRFHAPTTTDELAALLDENSDATLLAGGTDVGLWVTKDHREIDCVIYTGNVSELREWRVGENHIEIGAAVTFSDAMPVILEHYPELDELLKRFASPPIRNAATLGGNVANGSPIGDSMPALIAAGVSLILRSVGCLREIALDEFYHDYMVNDLADGEFVESLRIPLPADGTRLLSYKVSKRFDQDISAVCAGFLVGFDGDRIETARVAFGGMAATPARARHCEQALEGRPLNAATVDAAIQALTRDFTPIDDMRASADYRMRVAQNLLKRLALDLDGERGPTVYEYGRTG